MVLADNEVTDEAADSLYDAGCDDASIPTRDGVTRLQFDREATSLDDALGPAIRGVERAGLVVSRVEIERDEVRQIA